MEKMETKEAQEVSEKNGTVLYLSYENGYRSVKEFNEQLSEHYGKPIEMTREEICDILAKKAQIFAGKFDPAEITE
jgi:F420-0:gamma-glutamyl ligase